MRESFGLLAVIISLMFFNSCADSIFTRRHAVTEPAPQLSFDSLYGSYLAGRAALARNDFDLAGKYYIQSLEKDPENKLLLEQVYVLLSAHGDLDNAAKYAKMGAQKGIDNNVLHIILATDEMMKENYDEVLNHINKLQGEPYTTILVPMLKAWAYAGLQDYDQATSSLTPMKKEDWLEHVYNFHMAMVNDYFGKKEEAERFYEKIFIETPYELNFRYYRVIMDFYIRNNDKSKAERLAKRYNYDGVTKYMQKYYTEAILSEPQKFENSKISPQFGISDAFVDLATFLHAANLSSDMEYVFLHLAGYADKKSAFLKIMQGELLENAHMNKAAKNIYEQVKPEDPEYYISQIKLYKLAFHEKDFVKAEKILKKLIELYPDNDEAYFEMGEILRVQNKNNEAYKYYHMLLESDKEEYKNSWEIYYVLGMVCEQNNEWDKAEIYLKRAMQLSKNNYFIENYLGYSWLDRNKNVEQAFELIANAYSKLPDEPHVTDSLGWAFYKLGNYNKAIQYLEKAVNARPENALISDHLGDAYWRGGRKNEAKFQWNHALVLREDTEEVNKDDVRMKIENGLNEPKPLSGVDMDKIQKIIEEFKL